MDLIWIMVNLLVLFMVFCAYKMFCIMKELEQMFYRERKKPNGRANGIGGIARMAQSPRKKFRLPEMPEKGL